MLSSIFTHLSPTAIAACISASLIAVRVFRVRRQRWQRLYDIERTYMHLMEKPDTMTYDEAAEIMKVTHYWDFPWSASLALSFALFKTYAIPTISSVLCKSNELGSSSSAGRRAEDTVVFISEFLTQGLDSVRGSTALARMNFLHSRYGSLIKQEDLLFTLSLFVFEPIDYIARFEWRPLTPLEEQARYVFWREIGARMGIKDIPKSIEDFRAWKEAYADRAMVYAPTNEQTGDVTLEILLRPAPGLFKPIGKQAAVTLLDERVRKAFGWPRAPELLYTLVPGLIKARALFVRYLMYPRPTVPKFLSTDEVEVESKDGRKETRIVRGGFLFEPWYVPIGASWIGKLGFGTPGEQWQSAGWKSETLGPARLQDQGVETAVKSGTSIREQAAVCPFFQ